MTFGLEERGSRLPTRALPFDASREGFDEALVDIQAASTTERLELVEEEDSAKDVDTWSGLVVCKTKLSVYALGKEGRGQADPPN